MSLGKAFKALVSDEGDKAEKSVNKMNEMGKSMFSSKRLWIVVGFGALLFYVTGGIFNKDNLQMICYVAMVYIIGESISETARTIMNGMIKREEIRGIFKDGKIDDNERAMLERQTEVEKTKT